MFRPFDHRLILCCVSFILGLYCKKSAKVIESLMTIIMAFVLPIAVFAFMVWLELAIIKAYHRIWTSAYSHFAWILRVVLFAFNFTLIYILALMLGSASLIFVVPFACICLAYYWTMDWSHAAANEKKKNSSNVLRNTARLSMIVIMFSYVFPYFGYFGIRGYCFWQNSQLAEPIIEAVENYRAENGMYPNLSSLVPVYLDELPSATCRAGSEANSGFLLDNCSWGADNREYVSLYVLSYPTLVYSFERRTWSVVDYNIHPCSVMEGLD
jgi:hypothetical protein